MVEQLEEALLCPRCESDQIGELVGHSFKNLAWGTAVWTAIGVATNCLGLIAMGTFHYYADIPFGKYHGYYCAECDYEWKG